MNINQIVTSFVHFVYYDIEVVEMKKQVKKEKN